MVERIKVSNMPEITDPNDLDSLYVVTHDGFSRKINFSNFKRGRYGNNLVIVSRKEDLPEAVNGVIHLEDDVAYYIASNLDLTGDRIVCGTRTVIYGSSSETSSITSTGMPLTGEALITSTSTLPVRHITLTSNGVAYPLLDLNGNGTTDALDWFGVNFLNSPLVGSVKNYNNVVWNTGAFLNSAGLTFDGSFNTGSLFQYLLSGVENETTINIPATCTFNRRFRVTFSSAVTPTGGSAISATAASFPTAESFIFDNVSFAGAGNPISGITVQSNAMLVFNSSGISNTSSFLNFGFDGNASSTSIPVVGEFYPINATFVEGGDTQRFVLNPNGEITYSGAFATRFCINVTFTAFDGNNVLIKGRFFKNGVPIGIAPIGLTTSGNGRSENITVMSSTVLEQGDVISFRIANFTSTTPITVTSLEGTIR